MPDIVITEFMDEAAVAELSQTYETVYDPALVDRPDDLLGLVQSARALIVRNRTQVRGDLLATAQKLVAVGRLGVGLDNIDVEACRARAIAVFPATGANDVSVAEYVIATALLLLRGAYAARDAMVAGRWPRNALIGREMMGRTMGLVGFGSIARETAARARAMGMRIVAFDPFLPVDHAAWSAHQAVKVELSDLLAQADVVSLHVPLTPQTRNLLDAKALAGLRPGAILINAARGGVVDESALATALREKRLGGAALDVFATEPLTDKDGAVFAGLDNVILTPHIAGVTDESNERVSGLIANLIASALGDAR